MNQLAAALRQLRTETGLSLAGLATKTPYSKSSWERYLNGKTLPPREAVEALCRLAGEPVGRCVALWEIAEAEGSGRGATPTAAGTRGPATRPQAAAPPPVSAPPPTPQRGVITLAVLASVCAVAVTAVVLALLLIPDSRTSDALSPTAATTATPIGPGCHGATCEGRSPMAMRCAARPDTVARHRTATGAWMELRHSRECGTTWARTWGGRIGDRIEMTVPGRTGAVHGAQVGNTVDAESYVYTLMAVTGPGTVVRACFQPAAKAGAAPGRKECFDGRVH
ncbi:helix-turn-helix domain-containing protein [Streptomyces sp. NBC_00696]|uniref:helix-turn-helix domain-containing protein n=1 Tax=Streptomyces sp. NBC_00696 TaxID=2903672 RepID=UPI002E37941F|nr:helix-turn-helix domain-containing protein [Streptomyces sp. NBC_00696]